VAAEGQQECSEKNAGLAAELERGWKLKTVYLEQLAVTHPTHARRAERWRPTFLAMLTLTASPFLSVRKAGINYDTYKLHLRKDPQFAAQVKDAQEQAAQVLHAACWKSAIEGDVEPVYWQGIKVGYFKKYDSRLRVELLRAHMPERFKRPGQCAQINIDNRTPHQVIVTREVADDLAARWRASQERRRARTIDSIGCPLIQLVGRLTLFGEKIGLVR